MEENNSTQESVKKSGVNPAIPLALIGLIIIIAVGIFAYQGQQGQQGQQAKNVGTASEQAVSPTTVSGQTNDQAPTSVTAENEYQDGVYTAEGDYTSPGGAENIGVTLTLKNGVIEDAEIETMGNRPNTVKFQEIFKENFKQFVVGKNIDEVKLDKVAGSSLSPKGFNDALEKIKSGAKA